MKRTYPILSFLLFLIFLWYSFYSLMPSKAEPDTIPDTEFSAERALVPLKEISKAPHYIGSEENARVREFLMQELRKLGLEPQTQEGYIINDKWEGMDKPVNIVARWKGSEDGKSLMIFSHYDSALVPSFGASDAGSGVVTILESLRAYKASGKTPKNDLIIVFTDGEEVGLDGAKLFVREHPWAKNVGLALNFEARGSGGPSNMIVETSGGNKNLIQGFIEAKVEYPVASSLMYSVYKMLPNDTDSTVLREEGDIDGLFFAFIDDHFDYHTANDNFERLDRNTLQHQGSYLLPLLHYFAEADLSQLKSQEDYVYVNVPFMGMISYPFSWIIPLLILATLLFFVIIVYGFMKGRLTGKGIGKGFIAFVLPLIISGLFGYFGWKLLLKIYPHYEEIQQGFTYNGHSYIAFFVLITIAMTVGLYRKFAKGVHPANQMVTPLFFWLLINLGVALYLKGAAYFIIPFSFGLIALWVCIRQEAPNLLLMVLLGVPALFVFAPLVQFFPIGLGLKMLVLSTVFSVLLFGLFISVFGFYKRKRLLGSACLIAGAGFFISAHMQSSFTEGREKPNSLLYYQDTDTQNAYWLTYDTVLDDWTKSFLGENPMDPNGYVEPAAKSKYNSPYTYAAEAPMKAIPGFIAYRNTDTLIGEERKVSFTVVPQREVDAMHLYLNKEISFNTLSFNGVLVDKDGAAEVLDDRDTDGLMSYYVAPNDTLEISYAAPKDVEVAFTILEFSFDLLQHPEFSIPDRPKHTMTKPFVFNDAVVLKKVVRPETLIERKADSLNIDLND